MYARQKTTLLVLISCSLMAAACTKERQPRSVSEFLDNPQFLEAAVVRCSVNRAESRYDTECVNARQAVALIEAREERARRAKLEAESESKRAALRRTQRAAAAARREAAERARRREEAEYLAQFGEVPPPVEDSGTPDLEANTPGAVIPSPPDEDQSYIESSYDESEVIFDEPDRAPQNAAPVAAGSNAPVIDTHPEETDLDSIRDELKRRQEESSN